MNDLGKAFSFPFKDDGWFAKFLLGALFMVLSIFIIGFFIVAGYLVQVVQRVMRREPNPMPEWDDIGGKLVLGFKFCLVYLIYCIPLVIVYIPLLALAVIGEVTGEGEIQGMFAGMYAVAIMFIVIPYALILSMLLPVITARFARHERIADALDIGGILKAFGRNWQNTVIVALIAVGIQSFAAVGLILLLVGVLFTIFYTYLVSAYMFGALALEEQPEEGLVR